MVGGRGDEGNPPGGETSLKVNTSSRSAARPGLGPPVFAPRPATLQPGGRELPRTRAPMAPTSISGCPGPVGTQHPEAGCSFRDTRNSHVAHSHRETHNSV